MKYKSYNMNFFKKFIEINYPDLLNNSKIYVNILSNIAKNEFNFSFKQRIKICIKVSHNRHRIKEFLSLNINDKYSIYLYR